MVNTNSTEQTPMHIGITGCSGLIGTRLKARLDELGHQTYAFVRRAPCHKNEIRWSPKDEVIEERGLDNLDAVIHLAGEPIFGRWSKRKKQSILESRVKGTRTLADAIAQIDRKCAFISASGIGIYGSATSHSMDESSPIGTGFLAEVCEAWEGAAAPAKRAGQRVVHPRIGVVLTPLGGALKLMLPAFKSGVGGVVGTGLQWMSWVTLDEVVEMLIACTMDHRFEGPVNCVSPTPVQNKHFTQVLGQVLKRPTVLPVPRFGLQMLFGQMADETVLASQKVQPKRLQDNQFNFEHQTLESALTSLLAK